MVRVELQKAVLLYLTWLGIMAAALILVLADVLPFRLSFVRPENLFLCLTECQVFFVVVVWPLFIPSITRTDADPDARSGQVHLLLLQICVLLIFALPLALICSNVSNVGALTFLKSQALVAALAGFVASVYAFALDRRWRLAPWYFLSAFVIAAALPYLAFLISELGAGAGPDLSFLSAVSPFWGAMHLDGSVALIQAAIYGGLTLVLLAAASFRRRDDAFPAPAAGGPAPGTAH